MIVWIDLKNEIKKLNQSLINCERRVCLCMGGRGGEEREKN